MAEDNAYTIKWGILSTGWIAHQFATDLAHASNGVAYAVGSRSQESADKFAADHGIPVAYATYEELVNDPDVDAIYIGTPHPFHRENALLALRAGKAVLCEKPLPLTVLNWRKSWPMPGSISCSSWKRCGAGISRHM